MMMTNTVNSALGVCEQYVGDLIASVVNIHVHKNNIVEEAAHIVEDRYIPQAVVTSVVKSCYHKRGCKCHSRHYRAPYNCAPCRQAVELSQHLVKHANDWNYKKYSREKRKWRREHEKLHKAKSRKTGVTSQAGHSFDTLDIDAINDEFGAPYERTCSWPTEWPNVPRSVTPTSSDCSFEDTSEVISMMSQVKDSVSSLFGAGGEGHLGKALNYLEPVLLFFLYDMPRMKTYADGAVALYRLVSSITGKHLVKSTIFWIMDIYKEYSVGMQSQSLFEDGAKWIHDNSVDITTSTMSKKMKKLAYALVSLAVGNAFGKVIGDKSFDSVWSLCRELWKNTSVVSSIFDFALWFMKSAKAWLVGDKTLKEIFTNADEADIFDRRVARLNLMRASVDRDDGVVSVAMYDQEVKTLAAQAEKACKVAPKAYKLAIARQLQVIYEHVMYIDNMLIKDPLRMAPVGILLSGPTSQGKSCIVPPIAYTIQKASGVEVAAKDIFTINPDDQYWDGFGPNKTIIVDDDMGNTVVNKLKTMPSQRVIDVCNNQLRSAIMADLSEKGIYSIKPVGYIGTTNISTLHATQTSVEPLSILRRFQRHYYVELKDDPRYKEDGMFKPGASPDDYDWDMWKITSYRWRVKPGAASRADIEKYDMKEMSFHQMIADIRDLTCANRAQQQRLVQNMRDMQHLSFCEHGVFGKLCVHKICRDTHNNSVETQSGFTTRVKAMFYDDPITMREQLEIPQRAYSYAWRRSLNSWHGQLRMLCALSQVYQKPITFMQATVVISLNSFWTWCMYRFFAVFFVTFYVKGFFMWLALSYVCRIVPYITTPTAKTVRDVVAIEMAKPKRQKQMKTFAVAMCVATMAAAAYKVWRSRVVSQGAAESRPTPEGKPTVNVYTEQFVRPIERNMLADTMSCDQVVESFKKHSLVALFLKERGDIDGAVSNVFAIKSEHLIVPWHIVRDNKYKYMCLVMGPYNLPNSTRVVSIEECYVRIGSTDMALLRSPTIADRKDYTCLLADDIKLNATGCAIVWVDSSPVGMDSRKRTFDVNASKINVQPEKVKTDDLPYAYMGGAYTMPVETKKGMCGAPIVTDKVSGPKIVGFHSAGVTGKTVARLSIVTRADYQSAYDALHRLDIIAQSDMHERADHSQALDFPGTVWRYTTKVRPQSTSLWVSGEYEQLGYSTAPARTLRSNVKISKFSPILESEYQMPRLHEAPMNIGSYKPWNEWLTHSSDTSCVPAPLIHEATDDYAEKLKMAIDLKDLRSIVSPLDHMATINGVNGVKGCDAMKKTTSMGIPWNRPKKEFLHATGLPEDNIEDPHDFSPDVLASIQQMEDALALGHRVYVPHRCNLKDEAVKIGKTKVRVFLGSALPYLYLMRKYFLPVSMFMQKHPLLFETAVGTNCYGKQWTKIAEYIAKHGVDRVLAGDYAKYDQKMEIALTKAAFTIIIMLCQLAGYDERSLTICRGLMTETIAGMYDVRGEWIGLAGGNPSGHALTVIINSIVNSLYMRCAYYALRPWNEYRMFAELVSLLTYGDDNIASVSEDAPWFNHTAVSNKFAEWNITYTMADKDAESIPYITLNEASFLKRSFVKVGEEYYAPLDEASIMKTLHTYLESKALDEKEQHAQLLLSANREYFLYGRETYEKKREMLMDLGDRVDVLHFLKNRRLDTYEEASVWFADQ